MVDGTLNGKELPICYQAGRHFHFLRKYLDASGSIPMSKPHRNTALCSRLSDCEKSRNTTVIL